jgi:hypothetical protein
MGLRRNGKDFGARNAKREFYMSSSPEIHPGRSDRGIKQIEAMGIADRTTISDLKGLNGTTPSV